MNTTAQKAEYPFSEYKLYKLFHKKQGRWLACLVSTVLKRRTTLSFARYVLSVHLGRLLTNDEQADHVNGDKTDDAISNLQILSKKANISKYRKIDNPVEVFTYKCPVCQSLFTRAANRAYFARTAGHVMCCSSICGHKKRTKAFKQQIDSP